LVRNPLPSGIAAGNCADWAFKLKAGFDIAIQELDGKGRVTQNDAAERGGPESFLAKQERSYR
jgi:hypothetical protein